MTRRRNWSAQVQPVAPNAYSFPASAVPAWVMSAPCASVDPEVFFPEMGASVWRAKEICSTCPVKLKCLNHALERNEVAGVWGGTSPNERKRLRKAS